MTAPEPRRRILIVDDHPLFRLGIRALLDATPDLIVCGEAEDSRTAIDKMKTESPDLALIDLSLQNDENGLELLKSLHATRPDMPILILSVHEEEVYAERALHAGARGYLMKDTPSEQILRAVRDALTNRVVLSPSATQRLLQRVRGTTSPSASPLKQLSDRQLQVFELLGRGRRTRDIAAAMHISTKTVETHISNIKRRLCISSLEALRQQAAVWIHT